MGIFLKQKSTSLGTSFISYSEKQLTLHCYNFPPNIIILFYCGEGSIALIPSFATNFLCDSEQAT